MNGTKLVKIYNIDGSQYVAENINDAIKLHEWRYNYEPHSIETVYQNAHVKEEPTFEMVCEWLKKNIDKYCLPTVEPSYESEGVSLSATLISNMCEDFENYFNGLA